MPAREGHENKILCPDGIERVFRSKLEERFLEYLTFTDWKITDYGEKSYTLIEDVFQTQSQDKELERQLNSVGVFYDIGKMMKPRRRIYTPDFHVEINGIPWVIEVKSYWKSSDGDSKSYDKVQENNVYQFVKTLFLSQYNVNFLEVSTDKSGKSFNCKYYKRDEKIST